MFKDKGENEQGFMEAQSILISRPNEMIILKSNCMITDNEIKKHEEELSKKLGRAVVIIDAKFDIVKL